MKNRIEEIEARLRAISDEIDAPGADLDAIEIEIHALKDERNELREAEKAVQTEAEQRSMMKQISAFRGTGSVIETRDFGVVSKNSEVRTMDQELQLRAFQKYLTGGMQTLNDIEQRALDVSGSAAVMPTYIMDKLITGTAYSDLLHRATVIHHPGAAKIQIPIASSVAASWKIENSSVDSEEATYDRPPTLTKLDVGGFELMRLMNISAATSALSVGNFEAKMLELLAEEVIEAIELSIVAGSGTGQPKGLDNLTWVPDTNQILTASAVTAITAADIAEAMSLLPQKYARNSIVLVNAATWYSISQFLGTSEYAYNLADGATKFLGRPIVISEHMSDDIVYVLDPSEIYVRFSLPIQVEADRSSGFQSASISLRALTVVDAVINPAACVAVGLGAGGE